MKFYEKHYASSYDELITYYPRYYRNVYEMVEILKAHGRLADRMEADIEQAFFNGFIDYADEAAIAKLEGFLGIAAQKHKPIGERRRLVKSYFIGFGKISATLIRQMIGAYTDSPVSCRLEPFDDEGNNKLYIDFERSGKEAEYISDVMTLIHKKIPAHITTEIVVDIGTVRHPLRHGSACVAEAAVEIGWDAPVHVQALRHGGVCRTEAEASIGYEPSMYAFRVQDGRLLVSTDGPAGGPSGFRIDGRGHLMADTDLVPDADRYRIREDGHLVYDADS